MGRTRQAGLAPTTERRNHSGRAGKGTAASGDGLSKEIEEITPEKHLISDLEMDSLD